MCRKNPCTSLKRRCIACCCCMSDRGTCVRPENVVFKKKCMFFAIVVAIIFTAILTVSSTLYLSASGIEWVTAKCHVSSVTWKSDLYSIYVIESTGKSTNATLMDVFGHNNNNNVNISDDGNNNQNETKPTLLQVQGWLYMVDVKYKNMYFQSIIRDPSEAEMIPPLFPKNTISDCLCMIEKLRFETTLQKEEYEKYKAYMTKQQQSLSPSSPLDYIYKKSSGGNNDDDDEDEAIFFITATMWPKIDELTQEHVSEKYIKIFLVTVCVVMMFIFICMLRVFYKNHVSDDSQNYTYINKT